MKKVIVLLAMSLLAGCAGSMQVTHDPIKTTDGSRTYLVKNMYGGMEGTKEYASEQLDKRSDKLCKSGYIKVSEDTHPIINVFGMEMPHRSLVWEIKCNGSSN